MIRLRGPGARTRRPRPAPWLAVATAIVATLGPTVAARALHPSVESAIALADDADFAGALRGFDLAERGDGLALADLVALYAHRAIVHFARGDRSAMEHDLANLLALEPNATLPPAAPPPVLDVAAALRRRGVSRPTLAARAELRAGTLHVRTTLEGDVRGLVRGIRISARSDETAPWTTATSEVMRLPVPAGRPAFYVVEAIGPGGAVVDSLGTRHRPRAVQPLALSPSQTGSRPRPTERRRRAESGGGGTFPWWTVAVGAGAATAIGVVVAAVAASSSSDGQRTALGGPILELD
ncbi:MAG: hypothetical protein IT379_09885 [Deltaproteobacteria bacterium]|nr:hypothetical protein [Deltaproteobacteria bacterium]